MASIEERKRQLAELREARAKREAAGAAATVSTNPSAVVAALSAGEAHHSTASSSARWAMSIDDPSPPHSASASPHRTSHYQKITKVIPVAQVSIAPDETANKVITYEKAAMTHHVYIYDEPPVQSQPTLARQASTVTPTSPVIKPPAGTKNASSFEAADAKPFACPPRAGETNKEVVARWEQVENTAKQLSESQHFSDFVHRTAFVAEKCLQPGQRDVSLEEAIGASSSATIKTDLLSVRGVLQANVTRNVTCLCMQPGGSEFFAASYSDGNPASVHGLVHVWSVRSSKTPAFTFQCDADVATVAYCATQPQILIGGTYNGRIIKWDMRAGSDPVSASFPWAHAHTTALTAVNVTPRMGSKGAGDALVSASADGNVCVWGTDDLVNPEAYGRLEGISANCLAFSAKEADGYFVGSADGNVYHATKPTKPDSKLRATALSGSHAAAITSIECHPAWASNQTLPDAFLTSSLDWSCRVWYRSSVQQERGGSWLSLPVQCNDFIYDAKWCPTNPAVFACGDRSGNVILYNAAKSLDIAASTISVGQGASVSKLCWDSTGHILAVGCSNGDIVLCGVSPKVNRNAETDVVALSQLFS